MATEIFNRYEYKYLLDKNTYLRVLGFMDEHMEPDPYNKGHREPYTIDNIYYDTPDDHLIRSSLQKPSYKEKLRLRAYGVPETGSRVFLEIKKKFNGLVNKRRTELTLEEAYRFLNTGALPDYKDYINRQVLNEIAYMCSIYDLRPKLCIAYDRIAYFEKGNPDLRISFDMNIRSRRTDIALEKGSYGTLLMDKDLYLMEIKTSLAEPLWLAHMINELGLRRSSFSKYGTEFRKMSAAAAHRMNAM